MNTLFAPLTETQLKRTKSRCPVCHLTCPAEVVRIGNAPGRVELRRTCAVHGQFSVCVASDARFYWLAKGDPQNAACSGGKCCSADGSGTGTLGRNARAQKGNAPFETLSTCLALIEIVNSCNLSCPTCYADSPLGLRGAIDAVPLTDLQNRIQSVIDRKGKIEILQLSGGEPTLHPEFFDLVRWAQAHPGIDYLLLNTNGIRIARDDAFLDELGRTFHRGGMQLYLQFDGPREAGQKELRGADLRALRLAAIDRCQRINLPLTLAMTVTPTNLAYLWETIAFGLRYPHIRGVSFQPLFKSGRVAATTTDDSGLERPSDRRLNVADIILASVEQSQGRLRFEDFTPLPCGDPNCATIGYLLKIQGEVRSISDFVDFAQVQDFLHDRIRYQLSDLSQCGCETEPLGALLKQFELDATHTFRLFIKPFMDAGSWDEDRIDRCCTHVIRPDGKLDSFCRYYAQSAR
jgi:7,8-dihydro-6-hydroxymethylpterin dimethyltransferase